MAYEKENDTYYYDENEDEEEENKDKNEKQTNLNESNSKDSNVIWREIPSPEDESKIYKQRYGSDVDVSLAKKMEEDVKFEYAVRKSLKNEGGYSDRKTDPGGETMHGISSKTYPTEPKKELTEDRAKYIYYRDFYNYPGFKELPDGIREQVFDASIYKGQPTVAKILQETSNSEVDGLIGPETLHDVEMMDKNDLSEKLFFAFNEDNEEKIKKNPDLAENRQGWYNRNKRMILQH